METIQEIHNKKQWEEFLEKNSSFYPLFQSWAWGDVQFLHNYPVTRLGFYYKKKLIGVCQVVEVRAKRGNYLHLRHGPVFAEYTSGHIKELTRFLRKTALQKDISFIRISPLITVNTQAYREVQKMDGVNAPIHNMDAETCWVLDVTKSEEDLLSGMRKTHRYLIKKAQSMDIKIVRVKKMDEINKFLSLYKDLSERKHFIPHKGVKEEYEVFSKENQAIILLAEYQKKIISGAFITFVPGMAIYRHGASAEEFRNIPASYLLQWEAIKETKKRGLPLYNFWGIAPTESHKHPWYGLSLFKKGFGGEKREFMHAQDIALSPMYWKTFLIDTFDRIRKGY